VNVVFSSLRGLALSRAFEPVAGRRRDPWPEIAPVLERALVD
jgi:hypothetical protein